MNSRAVRQTARMQGRRPEKMTDKNGMDAGVCIESHLNREPPAANREEASRE
jgi:hypothetical protein